MPWNMNDIERLKSEGKIRGFNMPAKKEQTPAGRIVAKHYQRKSKGLDYISANLLYWCNEKCLTLIEEYKFHPGRKWRFDFAIPAIKAAVEFEGGIFDRNGGHTSVKDFSKDTDKYNSAAVMGWTVLRFTALNYENLISELNKLFENGNKNRAVAEGL